MSQLWKTIEYKLSNESNKSWANKLYSSRISAQDHIKDLPETVSLKIKTNKGVKDVTVKLKFDWGNNVVPDLMEVKWCYMLKGDSPGKFGAIYIASPDWVIHPQIVALNKQVREQVKEAARMRHEEILAMLREKLPPAAQEALRDDLQGMCDRNETSRLHAWFVKHNFNNVPSISELCRMKELGYMHGATKSNTAGITRGKATVVYWDKKTFFVEGFSSD